MVWQRDNVGGLSNCRWVRTTPREATPQPDEQLERRSLV